MLRNVIRFALLCSLSYPFGIFSRRYKSNQPFYSLFQGRFYIDAGNASGKDRIFLDYF